MPSLADLERRVARLEKLVADDCETKPDTVTLAQIIAACASAFGVSERELCSDRRTNGLVEARAAYYVLACELTRKSLPVIGRRCGNRNHTTVLHGLRRARSYDNDWGARLNAARRMLTKPDQPA